LRESQEGIIFPIYKGSKGLIATIVISAMGGIANWLMSDDHDFFQFIVSIFLAGFVGFLVGELLYEYKFSDGITFFSCGISGLVAEILLKIMRREAIKRFGTLTNADIIGDLDDLEKEEKKRTQTQNKREKKRKKKDRDSNSDTPDKGPKDSLLDDVDANGGGYGE